MIKAPRRVFKGLAGPVLLAIRAGWALFAAVAAEAGCWVSSPGVAFGEYDVIYLQPRDSASVIQIGCLWGEQEPQDLRVALGPSSGSGAIYRRRLERLGGGGGLEYNLFLDPARSLVWGDDSSGGSALRVPGMAATTPLQLMVYGRIFGSQDVMPGYYTDSVPIYVLP